MIDRKLEDFYENLEILKRPKKSERRQLFISDVLTEVSMLRKLKNDGRLYFVEHEPVKMLPASKEGFVSVKPTGEPFKFSLSFSFGLVEEKMTISGRDLKKIRHNLICYALTGLYDTDKKISDLFVTKVDGSQMTPDLCIKMGNNAWWIEITASDQKPSRALRDKYKYVQPLTDLAKEQKADMGYVVFIVSQTHVMTPVPLKKETMRNLEIAFRLGNSANAICKANGWLELDLSEEEKAAQLLMEKIKTFDSMKRIPKKSKDPTLITRDLMNRWTELSYSDKFDKTIFETIRGNLFIRSINELTKLKEADPFKNFELKLSNFLSACKRNPLNPKEERVLRHDSKAVVQLPILMPLRNMEAGVGRVFYVTEEGPLCGVLKAISETLEKEYRGRKRLDEDELWDIAFREEKLIDKLRSAEFKGKLSEAKKYSDAMESESSGLSPEEKKQRKTRNKEIRFEISFNSENLIYLHSKGIMAKHHKEHSSSERKRQQIPFSMDVDNSDITDFIMNGWKYWLTENTTTGWDPMRTVGLRLRELSASVNDNPGLARTLTDKALDTNLGKALLVLDWIVQEANASLTVYSDNSRQMLCKEICDGLWMVGRSAGATKMFYYSMIFDHTLFDSPKLPFKTSVILSDKWSAIDFVTIDRHRASHLFNAESCMAKLFFWGQKFDWTPQKPFSDIGTRSWSHFAYTMLMWFTDKGPTSLAMMQNRFLYNEMTKCNTLLCDPLKILEKIQPVPRCRFLVWHLNRTIEAARLMLLTGVMPMTWTAHTDRYDEEDEEYEQVDISNDQFEGLFSLVDMLPVRKMEICLEIAYVGSCHNKDAGEQNAGFFKIHNKIVEQEFKLADCRPQFMGREVLSNQDYKSHEFDPIWVTKCAQNLKEKLMSKLGLTEESEFETWQEKILIKEMMRNTTDSLATFKASAVFRYVRTIGSDPTNTDFKQFTLAMEHSSDKKERVFNVRQKMLMNIVELMLAGKISTAPLFDILVLLEDLEKQDGCLVNLFKKLQLQGVREIFVLDIYSRLCILFLETWARAIGEYTEEEMLTKGDLKYSMLRNHFQGVSEFQGDKILNCFDSDDASTWCQQFIMPTFGCFLMPICATSLRPLMMRILNCVAKKKIEMAVPMLKQMELSARDPSMTSISEPAMNKLRDMFNGEIDHKDILFNVRGVFLINKSNFMQGILHYLSSLLHAGHMITLIKEFHSLFNRINVSGSKKLFLTGLVSSDDSCVYKTISYKRNASKEEKASDVIFLLLTSMMKQLSYPLMGAKQSVPKSTSGCLSNIVEFNSVWNVGNTVVSITNKFVYAATRIKPTSSLIGRQETSSNLLKQVIENGGSFLLAAILQEFQMRSHYCCLGMRLSKLFHKYVDILVKTPHPALGFFLEQPETCCGVLGFDFSHYIFLLRNKTAFRIERLLMASNDPELSDTGKPSVSVYLALGGLSKYKAFLKRLSAIGAISEDWRELGNLFPDVNLRNAQTREEALFKIIMKAMTPSSGESFSFNTAAKLYAAAVYILHAKATTKKNSTKTPVSDTRKFSLLEICYMIHEEETKTEMKSNSDIMDLLFPTQMFYDSVLQFCKRIKTSFDLVPCHEWSLKIGKIELPKSFSAASISLADCCRAVWFKERRHSKSALDAAWKIYQSLWDWLLPTCLESQAKSTFSDIVAMMNFIRMQTYNTRTIKFHAPFYSKLQSISKLFCVMEMNYSPRVQINVRGGKPQYTSDLNKLASQVATVLLGPPMMKHYKKKIVMSLLREFNDPLRGRSESDVSTLLAKQFDKHVELLIIVHLLNKPTDLDQMLKSYRKNIISYYIEEQKLEVSKETGERKWVGFGIIEINSAGTIYQLHVNDDTASKVEGAREMVSHELKFLKDLIKKHGFSCNKSYSDIKRYIDIDRAKYANEWSQSSCLVPFQLRPDIVTGIDASRGFAIDIKEDIGKESLILCQVTRNMKVLSYYPDSTFMTKYSMISSHFNLYTQKPMEDVEEVWANWVNFVPLKFDVFMEHVKRLKSTITELENWKLVGYEKDFYLKEGYKKKFIMYDQVEQDKIDYLRDKTEGDVPRKKMKQADWLPEDIYERIVSKNTIYLYSIFEGDGEFDETAKIYPMKSPQYWLSLCKNQKKFLLDSYLQTIRLSTTQETKKLVLTKTIEPSTELTISSQVDITSLSAAFMERLLPNGKELFGSSLKESTIDTYQSDSDDDDLYEEEVVVQTQSQEHVPVEGIDYNTTSVLSTTLGKSPIMHIETSSSSSYSASSSSPNSSSQMVTTMSSQDSLSLQKEYDRRLDQKLLEKQRPTAKEELSLSLPKMQVRRSSLIKNEIEKDKDRMFLEIPVREKIKTELSGENILKTLASILVSSPLDNSVVARTVTTSETMYKALNVNTGLFSKYFVPHNLWEDIISEQRNRLKLLTKSAISESETDSLLLWFLGIKEAEQKKEIIQRRRR